MNIKGTGRIYLLSKFKKNNAKRGREGGREESGKRWEK